MSTFAERIGVGQRQPNDARVADTTATKRLTVPGEHHPVAAELIVHRSGRVDATVKPQTVRVERDEVEQFKRDHGWDDGQILTALNRLFGVNARSIQHVR